MGIPGIEWSPKIGNTTFAAKGQEEQIPKIVISVDKGETTISSVRGDVTYNIFLELNRANAVVKKAGKTVEYPMGSLMLDKELLIKSIIRMAGDIMIYYSKETSQKIRNDLLKAHTSILEKLIYLTSSEAEKIQGIK